MFIYIQDAGRWVIPERSFDTKMGADTEETLDADSDAVDVAGDDADEHGVITDLVNTPALQVFDSMTSCLADVRIRCARILQGDNDVFETTFGSAPHELPSSSDDPSAVVRHISWHIMIHMRVHL